MIRSGFFNSVNQDRKYNASDFAEYFASFISSGVFPNPSTNLQVVAQTTPDMTVTVQAGKAWINGYIMINDDDYVLQLDPADGVLHRIDRVVARYDTVDREIRLEVKKGTFASTPVAPALQRDVDAYELGLADVYIAAGVVSVTQANITDLRFNTELCGIVKGTVDQIDTTDLFAQYQTAFNDWFQELKDVLDDNTAANLLNLINQLGDDLTSHKAEKATQNEYGHIRLQDIPSLNITNIEDLRINDKLELEYNDGTEWKSSDWKQIDDLTSSPGAKILISGTMEEGFFGEVPASELITGDALASECGISQGNSQHSTAGWLKFAYKGEIQFVAKKPIRHSISWDAINTAKCVYGDSGDKTVEIGGLTYKVRLMRALEPSNDPKTVASAYNGTVNHYSEWNRLMCQIHEQAIDKSWDYPDNIENDIGILEHNLGNGNQGMYSDADLVVKSGDGRASWCQEMGTSTSYRLSRGNGGVSFSYNSTSSYTLAYSGWRPVLELVS